MSGINKLLVMFKSSKQSQYRKQCQGYVSNFVIVNNVIIVRNISVVSKVIIASIVVNYACSKKKIY